MLEPVEHICMMGPKFDKEPNYDTNNKKPKVVLRTYNAWQNYRDTRPKVTLEVAKSSSLHGETLDAISRGKYKVIIKVTNDPKNTSSSKKFTILAISSYDIVIQL